MKNKMCNYNEYDNCENKNHFINNDRYERYKDYDENKDYVDDKYYSELDENGKIIFFHYEF